MEKAKTIVWIGSSLEDTKDFPEAAKKDVGYNLHLVELGLDPADWKAMPSIGNGVREIRVHLNNEYRTIYVVNRAEAIYVLHSFVKKTQKTSRKDIDLAKNRLKEIPK